MSLEFVPVSLDRQSQYRRIYDLCPTRASDYSFINIWGWANAYRLSWAWEDHLVWIRQELPEKRLWAPVGEWERIDWNRRMAALFPAGVTFHRVPQSLCEQWRELLKRPIQIEESQGDWDYIYLAGELRSLSGNRFHKKKNLVNQFWKAFPDARYLPMDNAVAARALELQEDWCLWRDCEDSEMLASENRVIARVLGEWGRLSCISGGSLVVKDTMVAYTVAERVSPDTLLIHFEKGHQDFKGCYQAINQMFLEKSPDDIHWVNREQDLRDPGLRKAKLSYQPADYLRKSTVVIGP